jgi:HicB family
MHMDITPFVAALRQDLHSAAEVGGPEVRAAAERLTQALEPAVRLTLMDALAQAAAEITHELVGASVDVRLKGRDPSFVVSGSATEPPAESATSATAAETSGEDQAWDSDEAVARITLRLPESLKARAEELAAQRGQSLNTWLVNAARVAANVHIDVSSAPFGPGWPFGPGAPGRNRASNKRIQGWVR